MRLPEDLKNFVAEPFQLFTDQQAGWVAAIFLAFCIFADYMGWWAR